MKKILFLAAAGCLVSTALCGWLHALWGSGFLLTAGVACGTTAYHLLMRLAVGGAADRLMAGRVDLDWSWFRPMPWEKRVYEGLGVRRWKSRMPTYNPSQFDPALHSWEEMAQATCRAEVVHEANAFLSFVPVLASLWFGKPEVFAATSTLAALLDLSFAVIQRYNRPRLVRLMRRSVPSGEHS